MDIFDLVEGPETARMVHFVMEIVKDTEDISNLTLEDFPLPIILPMLKPDFEYIWKFTHAVMIPHTEALFPTLMEFELDNRDMEKVGQAIFQESFEVIKKHVFTDSSPYQKYMGQALAEWSKAHQTKIKARLEKQKDEKEGNPSTGLLLIFEKRRRDD